MTDLWMPRLSEYLDGDLPDDQRAALERHVAGCAECAAALDELRQVVARARALDDRPPANDLWPGVQRRLAAEQSGAGVVDLAERRGRRFLFSGPQLAAAGIALMLLSGGAAWYGRALLRGDAAGNPPPAVAAQPSPGVARNVSLGTQHYDAAIADLQRTLDQHRGQLDTSTVRVIEQNLKLIDRAIAQARDAVRADPSSVYLNSHLADAMQRKIELLRRATAIAGAAS